MIPDKIYLNKYMIRPGMLHPAQYPADTPEVEYIRKDALLEWAKEMKRICKGAEPIDKAYQTVIDKLNSL